MMLSELNYLMNYAFSLKKTRVVGKTNEFMRGWSAARIEIGYELEATLKKLEEEIAESKDKEEA